jgi:hypothetical protein
LEYQARLLQPIAILTFVATFVPAKPKKQQQPRKKDKMVVEESSWSTTPITQDPVVEKAAEFLEKLDKMQHDKEIQERRFERLQALQLTNKVNQGAAVLQTRIKKRNITRKQKERQKKGIERAENFVESLHVKRSKSHEKAVLREKWKSLY